MDISEPVQLSRLRQIGWDEWDPIGLRLFDDNDWQTNCADEYDGYLLHVVSMLRAGQTIGEAVAYLDWVETKRMGGVTTDETLRASLATVDAIFVYLQTLI